MFYLLGVMYRVFLNTQNNYNGWALVLGRISFNPDSENEKYNCEWLSRWGKLNNSNNVMGRPVRKNTLVVLVHITAEIVH